jgi:hypothetical protein
LTTADANDLLKTSSRKQQHTTMATLACLAKYHGSYGTWKDIKELNQLSWSKGDSLQAFENIIDRE